MRKNNILKIALFVLILVVLFKETSTLVACPGGGYLNYQRIAGFYEEPEDSLDAVYIGGSNVYAFLAGPLAWERYGITIYPFTSSAQPLAAARYLIEDARKTQPDALYIIATNAFNLEFSESSFHSLIDYFPPSPNKFEMIQELASLSGYSQSERLEYFFPVIRYHSRWNELVRNDFHYEFDGLKGSNVWSKNSTDISESYRSTEQRLELPNSVQDMLESLLNYCATEHVNVLFVTSLRAEVDESYLAQLNTINDLVRSYGYPVVDMREHMDEIGLDLTRDYADKNHTNVHGAIKVTDYLAKYLVENYNFQDKRGDSAYSSWDAAYDKYIEEITPYVLDVEYSGANRDNSLAAPELSKVSVSGTALTVKWEASPGADGYQIYRKTTHSGWSLLERVGAGTLSYQDEDCKVGETYTYTVIAYEESGDAISWGQYDFKGVSGTATLDAPKLDALSDQKNHVALTWEEVQGADGYTVYRRVAGKSWIELEDVGLKTAYTDSDILADMPYEYRVRAYYIEDETTKWGSYSQGCLWLPKLSGPQVTAEEKNGRIVLNWPVMEGMTGYTVARKTAESDWVQLSEALDASCQQFVDLTAQAGTPYLYRVTAYLKYGSDTHQFSTQTADWLSADGDAIALSAPKILFAEPVGNGIQLVWEPQEYASAYRIYRKAEGVDAWTVVKSSTTANTYMDKTSKPGMYTYVVQTLHTENDCTYYGEFREEAGSASVAFKLQD